LAGVLPGFSTEVQPKTNNVMKIYAVGFIAGDGVGGIKTFSTKIEAEKWQKKHTKSEVMHQVFNVEELDFPTTKRGLMQALEWGSELVHK
jgi:hypothetical protein